MPTGYTAKLHDGEAQTFPEFAMACARAFGALVEMRDSSPDAPVPETFEAGGYHADKITEAEAALALLRDMPGPEANAKADAAYLAAVSYYDDRLAEAAALRVRYEAMLGEVRSWQPPTEEHRSLKDFMVEQLTGSIDFDCSTTHLAQPVRQTGAEWLADQIAKAERDLAYHGDELRKDRERAAERTAWVRDLRASLGSAA